MNKIHCIALIAGLIPALAFAAPAPKTAGGEGADPVADAYFSKNAPALTEDEKAAIKIGKEWASSKTITPTRGPDGSINYPYLPGKQYPVVCAVLQVCDIALQPGESVTGLNAGDPRYQVEPSISGSGGTERLHLILKPLDTNLSTTMVVATNRRVYHFRLKASREDSMPLVSFTYPEVAMAKWDAIRAKEVKARNEATIKDTGEYLGDLNFNYQVDGAASWKPVRVYNDGRKTIIEMPSTIDQGDAPALLVVSKDGGVFSDEQTRLVNYRLQGKRYIVDTIFEKAVLLAGVGSEQERVTITKGK